MAALKRLFEPSVRRANPAKSRTHKKPASIEWVVAGLGNPGDEYARSRHNAGFMIVDRIAKANGAKLSRRKFKGLIAEITLAGKAAVLVKPQTFYNLSGECVAALLGYFKIAPERLIVVHDELDIEAGRLRIKQGGGDAGNRGVRSIAEALGATGFVRVRIGIGRPADPDEDNKDYLLTPMNAKERQEMESSLERAAGAVEAVAESGLERAMNRYNQRV